MDAIAAAAGVGKGTLIRAFGSRDGLLEELWTAKLTALREAVEGGEAPLGPGARSRERSWTTLGVTRPANGASVGSSNGIAPLPRYDKTALSPGISVHIRSP